MAKEGSVAPKERVNIVYKPATGDAKEEVELPLKLLIVGDFTQSADARAVEDRDPISIDKDTFNDVLKAQNLKLDLVVPNRLEDTKEGEEPNDLALSIDFASLKDFDPDQIVHKIPELEKLMGLREALLALKSPLSNIPDFRKKVQSLVQDKTAVAKLLDELGLEKESN